MKAKITGIELRGENLIYKLGFDSAESTMFGELKIDGAKLIAFGINQQSLFIGAILEFKIEKANA